MIKVTDQMIEDAARDGIPLCVYCGSTDDTCLWPDDSDEEPGCAQDREWDGE